VGTSTHRRSRWASAREEEEREEEAADEGEEVVGASAVWLSVRLQHQLHEAHEGSDRDLHHRPSGRWANDEEAHEEEAPAHVDELHNHVANQNPSERPHQPRALGEFGLAPLVYLPPIKVRLVLAVEESDRLRERAVGGAAGGDGAALAEEQSGVEEDEADRVGGDRRPSQARDRRVLGCGATWRVANGRGAAVSSHGLRAVG
jgi:hypothetical protein